MEPKRESKIKKELEFWLWFLVIGSFFAGFAGGMAYWGIADALAQGGLQAKNSEFYQIYSARAALIMGCLVLLWLVLSIINFLKSRRDVE